jgi:tellurium resistance protein TerD
MSTGITLAKGQGISLGKLTDNLTRVAVGLGWDENTGYGADFDLDATALLVRENRRVPSDQNLVFYGNLRSPDGSVEHTGDDLTGGNSADGDDETINVDLLAVPANIEHIIFSVSIHEADARGQSFGQVRNAYIRIVDLNTDREMVRYNLTSDASDKTAIIFGELSRTGGSWSFKAVGQGYASGLLGIVKDHGVNVNG